MTHGPATIMDAALFAPLDSLDLSPTVVDIGARNGMFLLPPDYARKSHFVGFEPNQQEYEKLLKRDTDAMRYGLSMPRFKSETYHDCAVWNENGTFPFYITQGPGACTMMGDTDARLTRRIWLNGDAKNYEDQHSQVKETVMMRCRRLDDVLPANTIVDFLKIDTEGADTAVLEGADGLLKSGRALVIKTEFQLFPYYQQHKLMGDQQLLLNRHGYRLIGLDLDHSSYTRDRTAIPSYADRQLLYAGDAFYILDPDRNQLPALTKHRIALVCLVFGFNSLAISLLRDAALVPEPVVASLEASFGRKYRKKRILRYWNGIPGRMASCVSRLRRLMSR